MQSDTRVGEHTQARNGALRRGLALALLPALARVGAAQLPPPPVPPQNPITEEKRVLGKILFWEEQLSSDDTMACGTCHVPSAGGTDPRAGRHPGTNGVFGDLDDKLASPGVALSDEELDFAPSDAFGFDPQVTTRSANSFLMAAYAPEAFWDGRARGPFADPDTGAVLIPSGGALENQVLGPPLSEVEMGHPGRDWAAVTARLATAAPLALATDLPADVAAAIAARPSYPELFVAAFGTPAISAARIAFAIATYERTLVPDQTPWDRFVAGDAGALTPNQVAGWNTFRAPGSNCAVCHAPPLFTNNTFRNIGLRPLIEDTGRQEVTGNFADRGRFKVPSLRNVGLKTSFMHNGGVVQGGMDDLVDVIDHYIPAGGHVQFLDNLDPLVPPIAIPPGARFPLADFLANGLTDPRVQAESFPFDRPTLRSELAGSIEELGPGRPGSGGLVPRILATTPPRLGSRVFRTGVARALGGAQAWAVLALGRDPANPKQPAHVAAYARFGPFTLEGSGAGGGHATLRQALPDSPALVGVRIDLTWVVRDPGAAPGLARTPTARLTLF